MTHVPSWVLSCPNCKNAFEHSRIDDYKLSDFLDPQKPVVPVEGASVQCPSCGYRILRMTALTSVILAFAMFFILWLCSEL
jgi:hypothetical protein